MEAYPGGKVAEADMNSETTKEVERLLRKWAEDVQGKSLEILTKALLLMVEITSRGFKERDHQKEYLNEFEIAISILKEKK